MDLDDCSITIVCLVDEDIPQVTDDQPLRQREPQAVLADQVLYVVMIAAIR